MTGLDSIELTTSTDFIQSMEYNNFNLSNITKTNGLEIINYSLNSNSRKLGFNKISVNETFGTVKINVSSKILGENYSQGICPNTLDQFVYEISKTGLVLDYDFIKESKLIKVDIKNDLYLTKNTDEYINTLNQLITPKFIKTKYPTGIVFKEKVQQNNIILTGYAKEFELIKSKTFYKEYPTLINSFDNVLRIESRFQSAATIKKHIGSNLFLDVLDYKNINYSILNKIIAKQTEFKPLTNTLNMTNTEEKNFAQIFYLHNYYDGNFDSIIKHIKSKLGKNTKATYQRALVIKYLAMIKNADKNYSINNLNEIANALKE